MFGDALVLGGLEHLCHLIKSHSAQPVYTYSFEHISRKGTFLGLSDFLRLGARGAVHKLIKDKMVGGRKERKGVSHGDEHFLVMSSSLSSLRPWAVPASASASSSSSSDSSVSDAFVAMLTNFARGGNPTPGKGEKDVLTFHALFFLNVFGFLLMLICL